MIYEIRPIEDAYRVWEKLPEGLPTFFKYCVWATPWPGGIIRIAALFENNVEAAEFIEKAKK